MVPFCKLSIAEHGNNINTVAKYVKEHRKMVSVWPIAAKRVPTDNCGLTRRGK